MESESTDKRPLLLLLVAWLIYFGLKQNDAAKEAPKPIATAQNPIAQTSAVQYAPVYIPAGMSIGVVFNPFEAGKDK
jgi:hypothetical protein